MVDLDTDEGFDEFDREVLSKGAAGVPSAYKDGERCEIILDDEAQTISFLCPKAALHCVKRKQEPPRSGTFDRGAAFASMITIGGQSTLMISDSADVLQS
jgi:hypothetical protein